MGLWPAALHKNGLGFCNSLVFNRDIGYFHGSEESWFVPVPKDQGEILRFAQNDKLSLVSGGFCDGVFLLQGLDGLLKLQVVFVPEVLRARLLGIVIQAGSLALGRLDDCGSNSVVLNGLAIGRVVKLEDDVGTGSYQFGFVGLAHGGLQSGSIAHQELAGESIASSAAALLGNKRNTRLGVL